MHKCSTVVVTPRRIAMCSASAQRRNLNIISQPYDDENLGLLNDLLLLTDRLSEGVASPATMLTCLVLFLPPPVATQSLPPLQSLLDE